MPVDIDKARALCELVLQEALDELGRLREVVAAQERALVRWSHGVPIEGDYICPHDSLEDSLRDELIAACTERDRLQAARDADAVGVAGMVACMEKLNGSAFDAGVEHGLSVAKRAAHDLTNLWLDVCKERDALREELQATKVLLHEGADIIDAMAPEYTDWRDRYAASLPLVRNPK